MNRRRTWTSVAVGAAMIIFGFAEIVTGFRHAFFGLTTTQGIASTALGAGLGFFYTVSGVLVLMARRRGLLIAAILLALDVAGRIAMVAFGLFPLSSSQQTFGIVVGTAIAVGFTLYVAWRWRNAEER